MVTPHQDDRRPENEPELDLDQLGTIDDDHGISLDELSQAYAELIGKGSDPYEPPETGVQGAPSVLEQEEAGEGATCELCPKSIVEAILFVGHPHNDTLTADQLAALMRGVPAREVGELIDELNSEYALGQHPFCIVQLGAGYRLELREEFSNLRSVFYGRVREARLSQSVIDVLAIVAYQQGCTRKDVDAIRRRPSGAILSQLVRRRLLRVERDEVKPRTTRYFVTDRFLELFGLQSIAELPQSQDLD